MLSTFISVSEHDTRVLVFFSCACAVGTAQTAWESVVRVGAGLCMRPFFITQAIARHDIPTSSAPRVE